MKLTFLGAAREVTGSCTLVEAAGRRFLVDCGMEQGSDTYENAPLPVAPGEVDAMLLTHAHIDHSGRIPYLYKNGYRGPIYCTDATADLCGIMLQDSAHIQEQEAEWKNRKAQRSGRAMIEPDYTVQDAVEVMKQFRPQPYDRPFEPFPGVQVTLTDEGHLLGSAAVALRVTENGGTQTVVFSGDIGNLDQPLLRDPTYLTDADFVVMESTYGDRLHGARPDYLGELAQILQTTFDQGGNVVIPSFAVGRTQEMLYFIRQIKEQGLVHGHDNFPVYVDSPLATRSTTIFRENFADCCDEETLAVLNEGKNPLAFPGLCTSETKEDSVAINADTTPKVILSASGMCEAGRIRHHLKHNLWRPECTILFVGYQAGGTLGRALLEGADTVKLFGEPVEVHARIAQLTGLSGHADKAGLETWIDHFSPRPAMVFVNHGEDGVAQVWTQHLKDKGYAAEAPYNGAVYELWDRRAVCLAVGNTRRIEKSAAAQEGRRTSTAFERLVNMGKRLMVVIEHNRGGANKDLAKFASQIQALCDKWDR
ncbi:MAG: MBL fold metallo-hydrolase RNA specificity domain-containing protein [Gemmiger sp.]